MKNMIRLIGTAVTLALLTGCASTSQFVPFPNQSERIENPSKVRIYVVRPTTMGCGVPMKVYDGEKLIGKTGPKSYLCWERDPGDISISGKAENKSTLELTAESGHAYYIQQHVRMGFLFARNKLSFLNENEGRNLVSECSPPKQQ